MLFNSFSYIIFLPAVCILHWVLPHRYRWMLLLAASYYFYMCWNPAYAVLILAATAVSYVSALFMEAAGERAKKIMLFLAAVFCFGILFVFKYLNFVAEIIFSMGSSLHLFPREAGAPVLNLLLPIGISFYTFQTVSYVIDVYRGEGGGRTSFWLLCPVRVVFPAACSRADRTGRKPAAAAEVCEKI
jgi:alginate O-acetyltransferase complex protein AlgI